MSRRVTIEHILAQVGSHLNLSSQTERELLEEIRSHLEEAVAEAVARGEDEQVALLKAVEKFGIDEVGAELQEVHAGLESADAIIACILPVFLALVLRWLAFDPDGTAVGWSQLLARPGFWVVAVVALLVPALQFKRWSFALLGWLFFWLLTVIFIALPSVSHW